MNKMNVVGLLVLIATLPSCDYCCRKTEAPVQEVAVVQEPADQVVAVEDVTVGDLDVMPSDDMADLEAK